jgi:polar amino acid transport system substrate-binding protein
LVLGLLVVPGRATADAWDDIAARKVLRWGNDAEGGAPYLFHPEGDPGRLEGFEADFAAALAGRMGFQHAFVQNNWDMLVPALLQRGSFDIVIAGLERTPENMARVAMSRPYFAFAQQLVVRADDPAHDSLESLAGRPVGVLSGTASHRLLQANGRVEVRIYQDNVNYFKDLAVGRIDAVLADTPIVQANLPSNPGLRRAGPPFAPGFYAVAVPTGEERLLARINDAIGSLATDGSLRRIYERYGVWDEGQERVAAWRPASDGAPSPTPRPRSAWREWRTLLPALLRAAVTTVWVTFGGMTLALALGLALALARLYGPRPLPWLAMAYIEVFRGTPLLLQIYLIYYGLSQEAGLRLPAGVAAVLALGLNYAATEAENHRAGIESVPRGQWEAALSLGMKRRVALRRIILPQALRVALPAITNDLVAMFKDSSIVSVIAIVELTKQYQIHAIETHDYIGVGLMTAGIYLAMSWTASLAARRLERSLRHDRR